MNAVDHIKSVLLKPKHGLGKHISGSGLDRRLKNARTNKLVSTPPSTKCVLVEDRNAVSELAPGSQLSLDFGALPTDGPAAGKDHPQSPFQAIKEDFA